MADSETKKRKLKITVIGDGSVGKTSLIQNYTQGTFQTDYIKTIGAQISNYVVKDDTKKTELLFWDIAGQDDFFFLRPSFYRASTAAIIVYSLEENELGKRSFKSIKVWHKDIKKFCGDIPIILFANKVDLVNEKELDTKKIQDVVDKRNFLKFHITSAKTGQGVQDAFNDLIKQL
ncbi:MAG: Rab family GTPase [Candidatus Odinarchaeota archaeon]